MNMLDEAGEMGQVCWMKKETSWVVRHIQDQEPAEELRSVANLDELEELVRWYGRESIVPFEVKGIL